MPSQHCQERPRSAPLPPTYTTAGQSKLLALIRCTIFCPIGRCLHHLAHCRHCSAVQLLLPSHSSAVMPLPPPLPPMTSRSCCCHRHHRCHHCLVVVFVFMPPLCHHHYLVTPLLLPSCSRTAATFAITLLLKQQLQPNCHRLQS